MKKFVFFLFLVFLCFIAFSWMASNNCVEITQAQGVIEAARAAQDAARAAQIASQGLSDVGRGQTFILVLLTLVLVVLVGSGCVHRHPTPDLETHPGSAKEYWPLGERSECPLEAGGKSRSLPAAASPTADAAHPTAAAKPVGSG